ncbi:MAG: hexameric tyrosine-coordinated heme protein [Rhodobacterales bacterium]
MSDIWLSTLRTPDPQSGYDLAIKKLSRMAVKITQPDAEIREKLRPGYVALNFQTIAAANRYWSQELSTDGL